MKQATENSRRQHVELRRLADELVAAAQASRPDDASIQQVLSRLAGVLKVHVAMEIEGLYPNLINHSDPEVHRMAVRTIGVLKDTYESYIEFRQEWTREAVQRDRENFIVQVQALSKRLHAKTKQEEDVLYERVDAIYAEIARRDHSQ